MVGFIRPRPIVTRRTSRDGSARLGKGVSLRTLESPWFPDSAFFRARKKKRTFLMYTDFSATSSCSPVWEKHANSQLTRNYLSVRINSDSTEFTYYRRSGETSDLNILAFVFFLNHGNNKNNFLSIVISRTCDQLIKKVL